LPQVLLILPAKKLGQVSHKFHEDAYTYGATNLSQKISLGDTDILIPKMGIGAWAWGDNYWGNLENDSLEDYQAVFNRSLEAGVNFFDTAESYGKGQSESYLGRFNRDVDQVVLIASKFMPYPWRLSKQDLISALRSSLERLGVAHIDLYQMHWPIPPVPIKTWMDAMAQAYQQGLIRAVGVSNYSRRQMLKARDRLAEYNLPLASNQVNYSLINRNVEKNGLLDLCKDQKITLIAYSPLAQGLLTGKYNTNDPPPGIRRFRYRKGLLKKNQQLVELLRDIGRNHGEKTSAQVALNWVIAKGAVPIPGARNVAQLIENIGALDWNLTQDEVAALDRASQNL
jgi:aryl-alcohol dehydrogenase-like predicted oxidoreductase